MTVCLKRWEIYPRVDEIQLGLAPQIFLGIISQEFLSLSYLGRAAEGKAT